MDQKFLDDIDTEKLRSHSLLQRIIVGVEYLATNN